MARGGICRRLGTSARRQARIILRLLFPNRLHRLGKAERGLALFVRWHDLDALSFGSRPEANAVGGLYIFGLVAIPSKRMWWEGYLKIDRLCRTHPGSSECRYPISR